MTFFEDLAHFGARDLEGARDGALGKPLLQSRGDQGFFFRRQSATARVRRPCFVTILTAKSLIASRRKPKPNYRLTQFTHRASIVLAYHEDQFKSSTPINPMPERTGISCKVNVFFNVPVVASQN